MKRLLCALLTAALLAVGWVGGWAGPAFAAGKEAITSVRQLNQPRYTVGVTSNGAALEAVKRDLPKAKNVYLEGVDGYMAVQQGRIDAYAFDRRQMELAIASGLKGVALLPENIGESVRVAAGISPASKIEDLKGKLNRFLSELRSDGTLDDMFRRWVVDGDRRMPEIDLPASPALKLKVGTTGLVPPHSYYEGNALTGYDIELARRFAAWLGGNVEFKLYDYGGIIAAAATGDVDCIMANLNVTPERAEKIPFSDVLYTEDVALMVRDAAPTPGAGRYTSLGELDGKRIGVLTGSIYANIVKDVLPSTETVYFDRMADLAAALISGKIDAIAYDEPVAIAMTAVNDRLTYIPEYLNRFDNAFFLAKGGNAALLEELNGFIRQLRDDGTIDELQRIWFGPDESKKTIAPYETFPAPNGTLRLAQDGAEPPFVYMRDNRLVGYDIAVLARFCEVRGYRLEPVTMNFAGMIPAVQSGRCDLGGGGVTITAERAESVTFAEPIYSGGGVMIVRAKETAAPGPGRYASLDELDGKRIGVQTGSTFDAIALARLPKAQISYFNSYPDMAAAMEAGRIDGFPGDEPVLRMMAAEDNQLTILDEYMDTFDFGFVLPKTEVGDRLRGELDAYIASIQESGELKAVTDKWTGAGEAAKTLPDYAAFPAPKGVLTLATEAAYPPMNYFREGKVVGLEIDLVARFCEANGYGLKVEPMNFDSILPAVQSGKCDFAAAGLSITEERKESVNFSRPYYSGGTVMAVLKDKGADAAVSASASEQKDGFLSEIRASFERTFIREGRWRLFVEGVGITLLITALSIVCGTALGFGVYLLCRNGNPLANALTRFCVWLVQGTPMVVLLMILYYVAFSGVNISGVSVAVVAFTLTFGAAVYGMLRMGVGAIDRGQTEAAYALGYGNGYTFFRIILPQALPHFMPSYQGEVVALVKATAIVGYIAVQDLTKMGDIVRSRTYEAFFPLIAVAVLYFVMAGALNFLVRMAQTRLDPRRRRREDILRGIDLKSIDAKGIDVKGVNLKGVDGHD